MCVVLKQAAISLQLYCDFTTRRWMIIDRIHIDPMRIPLTTGMFGRRRSMTNDIPDNDMNALKLPYVDWRI